LIAGAVSRLVYDCNRPPDALDAMPARSEVIDVPGNVGLSQIDRDARVEKYYDPFRATVSCAMAGVAHPILVTVHSFTPIYHGKQRNVEIGVLHDSDTRLADAMLATANAHTAARVDRNQPYGPEHGVTHTLKEHALSAGHLNVMLEIRNDLLGTTTHQKAIGEMIAEWICAAVSKTNAPVTLECST
jgi:predicted N-formylglutamate amidohydrolase